MPDPQPADDILSADDATRPPLPTVEIVWPEPLPDRTGRELASIAAALMMHGALAVAVVERTTHIGGHGRDIEAVGIEIVVAGRALEASGSGSNQATPATDQAVDPTIGTAAAALQRDAAADSRKSEPEAAEAKPETTTPDQPPDAVDDKPAPVTPEPTEKPATTQDQPVSPANSMPAEAVLAAQQGGAALRGRDLVEQTTAAIVAARAGIKSRYGGEVYAALRDTPPSATTGSAGKVTIEFALDPSGAIISARVTATSGRKLLDDAAMAAVRQARFPAPPAELGASDLVYSMEYTFR